MFSEPDTVKPQFFGIADLLERFPVHLRVRGPSCPWDGSNQANLHYGSFSLCLCISHNARQGKCPWPSISTPGTDIGLPFCCAERYVRGILTKVPEEGGTIYERYGVIGTAGQTGSRERGQGEL